MTVHRNAVPEKQTLWIYNRIYPEERTILHATYRAIGSRATYGGRIQVLARSSARLPRRPQIRASRGKYNRDDLRRGARPQCCASQAASRILTVSRHGPG